MSTPSVRIARGPGPHRTDLDSCHPISEKRKAEAERIRQKYPDRIPVRPFAWMIVVEVG